MKRYMLATLLLCSGKAFATNNNSIYVQCNGLFDMLILRNLIDSSGARNLQGYVIGFGANKMAYTDNVNQTNIVCVLNNRQ